MKNPIGKAGFFSTPEDMESFQKYLSNFSGSEAVVANTCAFMAWNLASKIVDEAIMTYRTGDAPDIGE